MKDFDIEERVQKAKSLFKEAGYNCCQAVVLAYNDLFDIIDTMASAMALGFGGGMGRMREACGSVSGMIMLAGLLKPASDPTDKVAKTANYALVQEVAGQFKAINGTIICRELLKSSSESHTSPDSRHKPDTTRLSTESPVPSDRTPEYYKKRPCEELVGISARIIGEKIKSL